MGKLTEEMALTYLRTFKTIYDCKKETSFIEDNANAGSLKFFRGFGDTDTSGYIRELIYSEFETFPSDAFLKRIIQVLAYETKKNGIQQYVNYRVANTDEAIYINLGNGTVVVRINAKSVLPVTKLPVKFAIYPNLGQMALPDIENGKYALLRKYILVSNSELKLILVFILNCFFTNTHYVILILMGSSGSAKSFITKVLKAIIDPSPITLRNQIRKAESLVIAAGHCHLIDLNNCSKLSDEIQDIICTILTGGVATTREQYTNKGQSAIHTHNPIIINGIGAIITRDDALERALCIHLNNVSDSNISPISEKQLEKEFIADLPKIIGVSSRRYKRLCWNTRRLKQMKSSREWLIFIRLAWLRRRP